MTSQAQSAQVTFKTMLACTISAIALGISQPLYMPLVFGDVGGFQNLLGLLTFVGYVPLFYILSSRSLKAVFWLTLYNWTVQLSISLYWIYVTLHFHGHINPLFSVFITLLLPFAMGLQTAPFFVIGRFLSQRFAVSFLVFAPLSLCAAEYLRNFFIFGGFPWSNAAYAIGRIDELVQMASLVGVFGLVFFAGVVNSLFCYAYVKRKEKSAWAFGGGAVFLVVIAFVFGYARLEAGSKEFAPSVRVALVQGDIPQEIKNAARLHTQEIFDIYLDLHRKAIAEGAELVLWPESSYPWIVDEEVTRLRISGQDQVASVIGATAYAELDNEKGFRARNAALFLDYEGRVVKRYDKSHLVPFGEYVPWPMNGVVGKIVPGLGAFEPGTEFTPVNLSLSDSRRILLGATVCYEGIFPEISRAYAKNGATLLVNLTNDAWFGRSSAPYQHLLMYKMRSVESGLSFLRATNSGISGWFDPFGVLHKPTNLFKRELVVDNVPILTKKTLYVVIGDVVPMFSMLFLIFAYLRAVIPFREMVAERAWWKFLVLFVLFGIALCSSIYFSRPEFLTDESARTKNIGIFLLCLLVLVGTLAPSKRSRAILMAVSMVIAVCSLLLVIFESYYFSFGVVLGLLIYLMAFRIKDSKPVQ